jgi:surface carbohydrate biosynthesis protein
MFSISFSNPKKNNVVIIHEYDFWIKHLILKDLPSTTLGIYPENNTIYVTITLIYRLLIRMRFINSHDYVKGTTFKSLLKDLYGQYILACLDQMDARVVLTTIDNSTFFQRLTQIDQQRTYFAIQNGTRTLACVRDSLPQFPHPISTILMTNFFCFGQRDVDLYNAHGHKVDAYFTVGSLLGGYYKTMVSTPVGELKFDLCLISQWHGHFFENIVGDDFSQSEARRIKAGIDGLNKFLFRLLAETKLTLAICLRSDDEAERQYYNNFFGCNIKIVSSNRKKFSTYRTIEQSKLAIGLNSTTLSEVFAWGQKVLWCNVPDDDHFAMPEAGDSYFYGDDFNGFKRRIIDLLATPQGSYISRMKERARYINNYDPVNPPHKVIRAHLIKALAN